MSDYENGKSAGVCGTLTVLIIAAALCLLALTIYTKGYDAGLKNGTVEIVQERKGANDN